jgi:hypothetical protein
MPIWASSPIGSGASAYYTPSLKRDKAIAADPLPLGEAGVLYGSAACPVTPTRRATPSPPTRAPLRSRPPPGSQPAGTARYQPAPVSIPLDQERPQTGLSHRGSRGVVGSQPLAYPGDARPDLSLRSQRPATRYRGHRDPERDPLFMCKGQEGFGLCLHPWRLAAELIQPGPTGQGRVETRRITCRLRQRHGIAAALQRSLRETEQPAGHGVIG